MKERIKAFQKLGYSRIQSEMMCKAMKQMGGIQSAQEEQIEGQTSNAQEEQGEIDPQQLMQQIAQVLQQGADPNQILQQLVQMGIPQEQGQQLIEGVMQQMQGTPQMQQAGVFDPNKPTPQDIALYNGQQALPQQGITLPILQYPSIEGQDNSFDVSNLQPKETNKSRKQELNQTIAENKDIIGETQFDENGNPIDTTQKNYIDTYKLYNPFGGVDIASRLSYGAYNLGKGDTASGIVGLAGAGLGLFREGLSAYGAGKEEKRVNKEYQDKQYGFQNDYVMAREGGTAKNDWISNKIRLLEHENKGRSHKQNISIAYSMYEQNHKQEGGMFNGYAPNQKEIKDIKYNVSTNGMREGNLPDTQLYTKVYYKDGTVDYIKPQAEIEQEFKRMPNYQNYMAKQKPLAPEQIVAQMRKGGIKCQQRGKTMADLITGEYQLPVPRSQSNVEIEKGEITKDPETGEVQEALGKPHEEGGTPVNLKDGTEILSDHTKIGSENAKKFSEQFGIKLSSKDTFADVMDKATKALGITKINEEQASVAKKAEKVLNKEGVDETTQSLNIETISKKLSTLEEFKQPLLETRKSIFDIVFKEQEKIPKTNTEYNTAQEGGMIMNDQVVNLANKYGIDPQRAMELASTPKAQDGQTFSFQTRYTPTVPGYDVTGKSVLDQDTLSDVEATQHYTGKGYGNKMADVEKTINTHDWYFNTEEKKKAFREASMKQGSQKPVEDFQKAYNEELKKKATQVGLPDNEVKSILEKVGFTGKGVQQFDGKFGAFTSTRPSFSFAKTAEDIVNEANQQPTTEQIQRNRVVFPTFPDALYIPPSPPQSVYKADVKLPYIDPVKMSIEPNLVEAERQRISASNNLGYLPDAQRASVQAQMLATGQQTTNQAISVAEAQNAQAQFQADQYNANVLGKNRLMEAQNALDYERRTFGTQNAFEQALQNYYNSAYNKPNALRDLIIRRENALNQIGDYKTYNGEIVFENPGTQFVNNIPMSENDYIDKLPPKERKIYLAKKKAQKS